MGETCGTPWEVLVEAVMPTCRLYVGNLPKDRAVNLSCLSIFELAQSLIPETVHRDACNCGTENLFWPKPVLSGNSRGHLFSMNVGDTFSTG